MPPPESVSSATVTDLATARRSRTSGSRDAAPTVATTSTTSTTAASTAATSTEKSRDAGRAKSTPRKPANRRFDTEKVERLKAEIAGGRYEIDPVRVADRFIEHERNS